MSWGGEVPHGSPGQGVGSCHGGGVSGGGAASGWRVGRGAAAGLGGHKVEVSPRTRNFLAPALLVESTRCYYCALLTINLAWHLHTLTDLVVIE